MKFFMRRQHFLVMQLAILLVALAATALAVRRFDGAKYGREDDIDDTDPMAKLRERMGACTCHVDN